MVLRIPARFTKREEQEWVEKMRTRLLSRKVRHSNEEALWRRAEGLNQKYFGGELEFSIRWVTNQNFRWGSCTPVDRSIRLSHKLQGLPDYVLDYVIVHELAHLLVNDHSPRFWALVQRYPHTDKATGFLDGYAFAEQVLGSGSSSEV